MPSIVYQQNQIGHTHVSFDARGEICRHAECEEMNLIIRVPTSLQFVLVSYMSARGQASRLDRIVKEKYMKNRFIVCSLCYQHGQLCIVVLNVGSICWLNLSEMADRDQ